MVYDMIIKIASIVTALGVMGGVVTAVVRWIMRQNQQDKAIEEIQKSLQKTKNEQCLLTYGILACLDGLEQLGCNHTVPATREKINKHINKQAHDMED